ncbi:MAG TPA: OmpH family outer membrane protein [Bacteroidetes bacterium]|nr:OmpH family outer membrane protein [Bacteroidota bacterium]
MNHFGGLVKKLQVIFGTLALVLFLAAGQAVAQLKIAYLNSQQILENYKEVQDVRKQLEELQKGWEQEAMSMQKEIQDLRDKLETQSLLLSPQKKAEREQEIQQLFVKLQQFQQEKWGPQGQILQEEAKLLEPIRQKIVKVIQQIGEREGYDYVFDAVTANIVYAGKNQVDLTQAVLAELEKGVAAQDSKGSKK